MLPTSVISLLVITYTLAATIPMRPPNTRTWTVHLDDSGTYKWMVQIYVNWSLKWTVWWRLIWRSKYTAWWRPLGRSKRSGDVQLDGPNIRTLTVQMDNGPMDCPCYINLDRPNWRQSNEPPIIFFYVPKGRSKMTVHNRNFRRSKLPSKWTKVLWTVVHLDGRNWRNIGSPLDRHPFGRSKLT